MIKSIFGSVPLLMNSTFYFLLFLNSTFLSKYLLTSAISQILFKTLRFHRECRRGGHQFRLDEGLS